MKGESAMKISNAMGLLVSVLMLTVSCASDPEE